MTHTIEPFDHEKHDAMVVSWLRPYRLTMPPRGHLSDLGFVVDRTAVAWLYLQNSKLAYVDYVAADPQKTKDERDACLRKLFSFLEEIARSRGATAIRFLTELPTMRRRGESSGYKNHGRFDLYQKNLGG